MISLLQGLIRHWQPVMEERIRNPGGYDPATYFQKSWTGGQFANKEWVAKMTQQYAGRA